MEEKIKLTSLFQTRIKSSVSYCGQYVQETLTNEKCNSNSENTSARQKNLQQQCKKNITANKNKTAATLKTQQQASANNNNKKHNSRPKI